MNSHISWLKEWQNGAKSCSKPIQQTYFTQNGVEISQDAQEERFHLGVFSEKLKLTKSSVPSLITFNCDIKFPKGFLSLWFTFNWPFGYIKD